MEEIEEKSFTTLLFINIFLKVKILSISLSGDLQQ